MANVVMLLGKSGTGKSTSIKGLNPKETVIFNVLHKRLPFKGSGSLYNETNHNLIETDNYLNIINNIKAISDNADYVKNIVIDDMTYILRKEYFARAKESGYSKYTELAQHFQQVIQSCEVARPDLNVFMILHSEDVQSDRTTVGYKVATVGNLIDNQYNPMEVVPMVLYSAVKFDDKGKATFGFYTHRVAEGTVEIPAKSPDEMFTEDFIPNDLSIVVKAMNEYYN